MKNHSNSEKLLNLKNKCMFYTLDENSFYSLDLNSPNKKIINKKRKRENNQSNIYDKINKLELNQHKANDKLDLILSILKSKLLGKNDFEITHYDFCLININQKEEYKDIENNENELDEADIKEENDINVNDEFEHISQIKKGPHFNSNNLNRENLFNEDNNNNKNINIISTGNENLTEMINDFLNQNKNEKNDEQNDNKNNISQNDNANNKGQNVENNNEDIINKNKEEIKEIK